MKRSGPKKAWLGASSRYERGDRTAGKAQERFESSAMHIAGRKSWSEKADHDHNSVTAVSLQMARSACKPPGRSAESATEDRDSPKSFEWLWENGSLPQFSYAPGSVGIPERRTRTRVSSVPPTYNSGHADKVLAATMRHARIERKAGWELATGMISSWSRAAPGP